MYHQVKQASPDDVWQQAANPESKFVRPKYIPHKSIRASWKLKARAAGLPFPQIRTMTIACPLPMLPTACATGLRLSLIHISPLEYGSRTAQIVEWREKRVKEKRKSASAYHKAGEAVAYTFVLPYGCLLYTSRCV